MGRERLLELALQGVRGRAGGLALRRGKLRDGREDLGERTALASQDLRLEVLEPAVVGLRRAGVEINRKLLADLAVRDPAAFQQLAEVARQAL